MKGGEHRSRRLQVAEQIKKYSVFPVFCPEDTFQRSLTAQALSDTLPKTCTLTDLALVTETPFFATDSDRRIQVKIHGMGVLPHEV